MYVITKPDYSFVKVKEDCQIFSLMISSYFWYCLLSAQIGEHLTESSLSCSPSPVCYIV